MLIREISDGDEHVASVGHRRSRLHDVASGVIRNRRSAGIGDPLERGRDAIDALGRWPIIPDCRAVLLVVCSSFEGSTGGLVVGTRT